MENKTFNVFFGDLRANVKDIKKSFQILNRISKEFEDHFLKIALNYFCDHNKDKDFFVNVCGINVFKFGIVDESGFINESGFVRMTSLENINFKIFCVDFVANIFVQTPEFFKVWDKIKYGVKEIAYKKHHGMIFHDGSEFHCQGTLTMIEIIEIAKKPYNFNLYGISKLTPKQITLIENQGVCLEIINSTSLGQTFQMTK